MGAADSNTFQLDSKKPFSGIIKHLHDKSEYDYSSIKVTASGQSVRSYGKPEEVISPKFEGEWTSNNEQNSWFMVEFKNHKIEVCGYTIKTYNGTTNGTHMKSWIVEGSTDGVAWITIDAVTNSQDLNKSDAILSKTIRPIGEHSLIRIKQTDKNHFGTHCMSLARFELFGTIK